MEALGKYLAYTGVATGVGLLAFMKRGGAIANVPMLGYQNRVAIVTGSSCGIGKEVAMDLARRRMRVIMACKDIDSAEEAAHDVREYLGVTDVVGMECDLSSFKSIRKFASDIHEGETYINYLVNNAGVYACPYTKTEDGLEMQMGVNHFGHYLLTNLLIPKFSAMNNQLPRIVVVTSGLFKKGIIDLNNLNSEQGYDKLQAYYNSKLANYLFAKELTKRTENYGINVYCAEPLIAKTYLDRHLKTSPKSFLLKYASGYTEKDAAQTVFNCAVSPDLEEESGLYYYNCKPVSLPEDSEEQKELAEKLWEASKEITQLDITVGDKLD